MNHHIPIHIRRKIIKLKRHRYHHLQHKIREEHNVSRGTIFYMKEYGPHSHVSHVIFRESIKILVLAALFSSIGGLGLRNIQQNLVNIIPLLILLPALNDMIGDFGAVVASKFTTALYTGKVVGHPLRSRFVHELFTTILLIAFISALYISILSCGFSAIEGFAISYATIIKILGITLISTLSLVVIIFGLSIIGGIWIYKKGEDPNNFLIPIATSVADLGSMIIFAVLVKMFF